MARLALLAVASLGVAAAQPIHGPPPAFLNGIMSSLFGGGPPGVLSAPGATARINERALRIREGAAGVNGPPMLAGGGLRPQRAAAGADGAAAEALPGGKDSAPGTGLGHLCDAVACELGAQWNWARNGAATPTPLPAHSRPSKSSPAAPQA